MPSAWRDQILHLADENIYERYVYPNPPIMALLLKPLAEIEPGVVGALAWYYLKVGMALASLYWVFRLVQGGGAAFPPWARAAAPSRSAVAPVNAPFACPKISLSIRSYGSAAQFSATNGPLLRRLRRWMASAQISLPVPLSPVTNTVAELRAACSIRR